MSPLAVGALRFLDVCKNYRRADGAVVVVAEHINLDLEPGASLGVIGPNGAGKSTLLKLASGLTAPTSGEIRRRGRLVSAIELGAGFHPDLTGDENLEMIGALNGLGARSRRGARDEIVAFAGLESDIGRSLRTYSSGMIARLAFAAAAHSSPDILLLDEVLSVGDIAFQHQARVRMAELRAAGTTVVLVSHDLLTIEEVCDQTMLLIRGQAVEFGRTPRVIRRYLGAPEPNTSAEGLAIALERGVVRAGATARLKVRGLPFETARLRVELFVHEHPTFLALGENHSVAFAFSTVTVHGAGDREVAFGTAGFPDGRFEVRVTAESEDGSAVGAGTAPITISAGPGPFAFRLDGRRTIHEVAP